MKPFAYQYILWSCGEQEDDKIVTTLRAAVSCVLTNCQPSWLDRNKVHIWAIYPDESKVDIDLSAFRQRVELDMEALRAEAKADIAEDTRAQAEFFKTIKGTVTGSPWLCDMSLKDIVDAMVQERQWGWKTADQVDWPALEASLIK